MIELQVTKKQADIIIKCLENHARFLAEQLARPSVDDCIKSYMSDRRVEVLELREYICTDVKNH